MDNVNNNGKYIIHKNVSTQVITRLDFLSRKKPRERAKK